jgi:hypothetical protein
MLIKIILQMVYITIAAVISFYTFKGITYDSLKDIFTVLLAISAAVFTLAGLWIGYLYPEALSAYTDPDDDSLKEGTERTLRIERLVLTVFTSAFVMVTSLVLILSKTLISQFPFYLSNIDIFKITALTTCLYLSLIQIKAILAIMITNIKFINDIHRKKNDAGMLSDVNANNKPK